jgi:hypothetical protein
VSEGDVYLTDLLRRLDRQDIDLRGLSLEMATLKASFDAHQTSVNSYQNEMRDTVERAVNHFTSVTDKTQATCNKMEVLVKDASNAAHLAANSKSKTEKAFDRAMLALSTLSLFIVTAFGAPWLASKEDFWDTVWVAVKGAVKAKTGH